VAPGMVLYGHGMPDWQPQHAATASTDSATQDVEEHAVLSIQL